MAWSVNALESTAFVIVQKYLCILLEGIKKTCYILMFLLPLEEHLFFFYLFKNASRLFPKVWPSSAALRLAGAAVRPYGGGACARCVCSTLVEEGQLLSAAEEGREKLYNALETCDGLSPNLLIRCPSRFEVKMA